MENEEGPREQPSDEINELRQRVADLEAVVATHERLKESSLSVHPEWEHIFQAIGHAALVLDPQHGVIAANRAAEKATGCSEREMRHKKCYEIFHGAETPPDGCPMEKMLISGHWETVEMEMEALDRVFLVSCTPVVDDLGKLVAVIHIATDITERKRAEEELRQRNEFIETIMDNLPIGLALNTIDDGVVQYTNKGFEQIYGWSRNVITTVEEFFEHVYPDPDYRNEIQTMVMSDIASDDPERMKWDNVIVTGQMGEQKIVSAMNIPLCDQGLMISIVQDITSRKRTEEALANSEARFRELFEHMSSGVAVYEAVDDGADFVFRDFNRAGEEIDEVKREALIGKRATEVFPGIADFGLLEVFRRVWETGNAELHLADLYQDQRIRGWRENHVYRLPSGEIVAVYDDVTEQKRAEEALRESEEKHRVLFETMAQGVVYQDADGRITSANPAAERILGLTLDQMQGRTSMDPRWKALHEDGSEFPGEQHPAMVALRSGEPVRDVLMGVFNPVAEGYRWLSVNAVPQFKSEEETPFQVYTTFGDITDRKLAEDTLHYWNKLRETAMILSTRFINVALDDLDNEMNRALKEIGELADVDRSYLFSLHDDGTMMTNTHEWCADGITPQIDNLKSLPVGDFPWWSEVTSSEDECICIPDVAALPPRAMAEKEILQAQEICSLALVPIVYGGSLHGYLGFDLVRAPGIWSKEVIDLLTMAGQIFTNALDRGRVERSLRQSEEHFRSVIQTAKDAIVSTDRLGRIILWNQAAEDLFGYPAESIVGELLLLIVPERFHTNLQAGMQDMDSVASSVVIGPLHEVAGRRKDGSEFPAEVSISRWKIHDEHFFTAIVRDITDRKNLEGQLLQSQKMESIGLLAGGIAHDFNNALVPILGFSDLVLSKMSDDDPMKEWIEEIKLAGQRAASLTRQLLAFSRRQTLQPQALNLNTLIASAKRMLRRLIGEDIELITVLDPALEIVEADPGQIEQVIMNLAVNARDAMPDGGTLTISTQNVMLDEEYCINSPVAQPGTFVRLSIADTGIGMDEETIARIFEPFFTTKEQGSGTGLGMSVVYGIITQHSGWMDVCSEPEHGTAFNIYLPISSEVLEEGYEEPVSLEDVTGNGETILLVEDEEEVRRFAVKAIRAGGYIVFEAANADEAMDIFECEEGNFDMLFSDMVMPGKSGIQLVDELLSRKPGLKVLLSTGYADQKSQWPLIRERGIALLQKPYAILDLLKAIKAALGQPNENESS